jgi:DUF917 family protein
MVHILSFDEVSDLVNGATILGTGGGGEPDKGIRLLEADINSGLAPRLVDPAELEADSFVISAYSCGSIPAPGKKLREKESSHITKEIISTGLEAMRRELEGKISAIIPAELGGHNTAVAIHTAALFGLPAVDADQVGRAAPELVQSTYHVHGIRATPAVVADASGDLLVVHEYADVQQYEKIARSIAVLGGGHAFVIDTPVRAREVSELALLGTVSRSIKLGETVRKASEKPIDQVIGFLDGYQLFHGKVSRLKLKESDGFLIGTIEFSGLGEWRGRRAKVWVKNESIVAWRDGRVIACAPDLIMTLDRTGQGITNSRMKEGLEVYIIGAKSPEVWRRPRGLEFFGPRHFGFRFEYKPIEQLMKLH